MTWVEEESCGVGDFCRLESSLSVFFKVEFERIGIERDLSHYTEEILFLKSQVEDMQRDLETLHQSNQTILASHRHLQIQAKNLHASRL